MKSNIAVLEDLFGKEKLSFSKQDVLNLMNVHASQFRFIKTTCGKEVEFDDCDYETLRNHVVFVDKSRDTLCCVCNDPNGKRVVFPVAKLLLKGEGKSTIHYKDGNLYNLKRNNIEISTHQVSSWKSKKPRQYGENKTSSQYKGVSYKKHCNLWEAHIKVDGKKKHLGYRHEEKEAAKLYNEACIKYWGKEYSNLNKID